jgi:hypothetical protein
MFAAIGRSEAEDCVDSAKAAAFNRRIFARQLAEKTERASCAVMTPIIGNIQHRSERCCSPRRAPEEKTAGHSFRLGIKYRHRTGNSIPAALRPRCHSKNENPFRLRIDCEAGGIHVALSKTTSPLSSASCGSVLESQQPQQGAE